MSYDILFVPRRPGQTWDQALDEAEGRDVLGDAIRPERMAQWERVVDALRARLGPLEVSVGPDVCEAVHTSGLQVSLYPDEASVSFPYTDRGDRSGFHDAVVDVVGIVERETGLEAWDAQTDEPFDGLVHDETGLAATRRIGQEASDTATTEGMADRAAAGEIGPDTGPVDVSSLPGALTDATRADRADGAGGAGSATVGAGRDAVPGTAGAPAAVDTDLAVLQRRARRYVVIGVVVVVAGLLLGRRGGSSTLTTVTVVIGLVDIAVGVLLYRRSLRPTGQGGLAGGADSGAGGGGDGGVDGDRGRAGG